MNPQTRDSIFWRIAACTGFCSLSMVAYAAGCGGNLTDIPGVLQQRYPEAISDILSTINDRLHPCDLTITLLDESHDGGMASSELEILRSSSEAYRLAISEESVTIASFTAQGMLFALSDLQSRLHAGPLRVRTDLERPVHPIRALHLVMRGTDSIEFMELIRQARRARMNAAIVQIADAVAFDSFPGRLRTDAMPVSEFRNLVRRARQNGIEIIPEVKLLTHQEKFLQEEYKHLMYNKVTYDPRELDVYRIVEEYIDEIIAVIAPKYFHIGHDEVRGFGPAQRERWLGTGESYLPAELFLQDTLKVHRILSERGLQVLMWGDMLLEMHSLREIHHRSWSARQNYPTIIDRLPKDIIIVDWRYFDKGPEYPSSARFAEKGFRVMGATWHDPEVIENFSRYLGSSVSGTAGMIATTWSQLRNEEWPDIQIIITQSGRAFWNGG